MLSTYIGSDDDLDADPFTDMIFNLQSRTGGRKVLPKLRHWQV